MNKKLCNESKQLKIISSPKNANSKDSSRSPKKDRCDVFSKQKQLSTTRSWNCLCWPCYYCNLFFSDFNTLQSHQELLHQKTKPSENYYRCIECKEHLLGYASFLNHIRSVHYKTLKLCCDVCNEILPSYKQLAIHRDKHLDISNNNTPIIYHCTLCDEVYSTEKLLKHHIQQSHDLIYTEKPRQDALQKCEKPVDTNLQLSTNIKKEIEEPTNCKDEYHDTKLMFQCGKCFKNLNSAIELKNHMSIHFGDGTYKCDDCFFSFKTEEDRKYHMRAHITKYAFTCRVCKRSFNRSFALKVHMRLHTGDVSCDCYVCDMKFNSIADLNAHLRTATHEQRPLKCDKCEKDFKYRASFKKHKCSIPGERSFKCEICQKMYTNKKSFKNHQRRHAGGDNFECEICKKLFKKNMTLKKHMRLHIGKASHECDLCGKIFKKLPALKRHYKICSSTEKTDAKKV